MARTALAALGPVRLLPGLEACALQDLLWLRGGVQEKEEDKMLETLPWNDRYEIVAGKYLRPIQSLLPVGRIPNYAWIPLVTFIRPNLGQSLLPGNRPAPVPMQWHFSGEERQAKFLLARSADFLAFADRAAQVRLQHLRFAQAAGGQALIAGSPLPSLPGTYFYEDGGMAWPAGYQLQPRLGRTTWRRLLQLRETDLAVVHLEGSYSVVPESAWVKASRSAVRLSGNAQSYA